MTSKRKKYHTIFLDVGGTLIQARPSVGNVYTEIAAHYGIEADPVDIENEARRLFAIRRAERHAGGPSPHIGALASAREWWRELVRESFGAKADSPRFEAFYQRVFEEFARPERYEFFPESEEVLGALERAGHRIGIISNWDVRLRPVLEGLGIARRCSTIIISGEVGVEKPDPRIFELARERCGAEPDEPLLQVGDNRHEDVEAAIAAGFDARYLNRFEGDTLTSVLADLID